MVVGVEALGKSLFTPEQTYLRDSNWLWTMSNDLGRIGEIVLCKISRCYYVWGFFWECTRHVWHERYYYERCYFLIPSVMIEAFYKLKRAQEALCFGSGNFLPSLSTMRSDAKSKGFDLENKHYLHFKFLEVKFHSQKGVNRGLLESNWFNTDSNGVKCGYNISYDPT